MEGEMEGQWTRCDHRDVTRANNPPGGFGKVMYLETCKLRGSAENNQTKQNKLLLIKNGH
jgi:hypothetical protein